MIIEVAVFNLAWKSARILFFQYSHDERDTITTCIISKDEKCGSVFTTLKLITEDDCWHLKLINRNDNYDNQKLKC